MFANHLLVRRNIDAVNFVAGNVAVHPLDRGPHIAEDAAGFLRDCLKLRGRERSGAVNFAFNDEFGHWKPPRIECFVVYMRGKSARLGSWTTRIGRRST